MNKKLEELTLPDLLFLLWKHGRLLFILALAFGAITFYVSKFLIRPTYASSSTLIVNSAQASDGLNVNEIDASQKLTSTITQVLTSDVVLAPVIHELKLDTTPEQLAKQITAEAAANSNIISLTVRDGSPVTASRIVSTIDKISPDILTRTVTSAASVNVITPARLNRTPVSPHVGLLTVAGTLAGLFVAACIALAYEHFNNKFKTEDDVRNVLGLSVLGIIPAVPESSH